MRNSDLLGRQFNSTNMKGQQSPNPLNQQSSRIGNYDLNEQLQILSSFQKEINCNAITLEQLLQQQAMPQMSRPSYQAQNFPSRHPPKRRHELGMGGERLMSYMYVQRNRPKDNNIKFWRKFVAEFFTPDANKKWCVSMYEGDLTTDVLVQNNWHCGICNRKPGRGLEANANVLPRLFQIKYESGMLDELLYIREPQEYRNSAGQIFVYYAKAIQESVFKKLRIVRDGHLRIIFSPELKISSLEFCVWSHDELIPRRLLTPQVSQLRAAAKNYQAYAQDQTRSSSMSTPELKNICNTCVTSAKQIAKALTLPLTGELGFPSTYARCLKMSDVAHNMKDLIDYSLETGTGPIESLVKFPMRTNTQSVVQQQQLQQKQPQQQTMVQNSKNDEIADEYDQCWSLDDWFNYDTDASGSFLL